MVVRSNKGTPLPDRFERLFVAGPQANCWPWLGARTAAGYGYMRIDDKTRTASQIALELAGRPAPEPGLFALHKCDNPPCVNPDHLFWGTHEDNMADQKAKGRHWATVKPDCAHGHPWTPENTRIGKDGRKNCRTCERNRLAQRKVKRRAARLPVAIHE